MAQAIGFIMAVRPANEADVEAVIDLLAAATARARRKGESLWPERFAAAPFYAAAAAGTLHVAWVNGALAGTLILQLNGATGQLHKLAVAPELSGYGIGSWLLDWAFGQVSAAGKRALQLSCREANAKLLAYYERHGFELKGPHKSRPGSVVLERACPLKS